MTEKQFVNIETEVTEEFILIIRKYNLSLASVESVLCAVKYRFQQEARLRN